MSLQVWLPLNGDTKQQGLSNITVTGSPTSWNNGKIGKCAYWNGAVANTIYNSATDFNYTGNFSVAFWAKPEYTTATAEYAWTVGRADGDGYGYGFQIANATTGYFRFGNSSYAVSCPSNEWHHYTMTIGTKVTIYKDGIQISSNNLPTLPTYKNSNGLGLGCFRYSSGNIYPYYGSLNDFRIYDHCLSPQEVKELSKGLILHYPLNRQGWGQENLATCTTPQYSLSASTSNYNFFWINSSTSLEPNTTYTFSAEVEVSDNIKQCTIFNYTSSGNSGSIFHNFPADGKRHFWTFTTTTTGLGLIGYAGNSGSTANHSAIYKNIKVEKGAVATPYIPRNNENLYTIMDLDSTTEYDCSGFGNNGTKIGTLNYLSDIPKYTVSSKITITSTGIKTSNFYVGDIWTMSVWFKYPSLDNTGWKALVILNSSGGDTDLQLGNYFNCNDGRIQYSANGKYNANVSCTAGVWHHLVNVYDGTVLKGYLDGVQKCTVTPGQTLLRSNLGIGLKSLAVDFSTISHTFINGQLSDVRIYATALSADDVKSLYNNNAYIDTTGKIYGEIR